jgi:hypothetical protein
VEFFFNSKFVFNGEFVVIPQFGVNGERTRSSIRSLTSIKKDGSPLFTPFEAVSDGRGMAVLTNVDERIPLSAGRITERKKIYVKYTIIPFLGHESSETVVGYLSGCTLKLLLISLLDDSVPGMGIETPSMMRKRMREV